MTDFTQTNYRMAAIDEMLLQPIKVLSSLLISFRHLTYVFCSHYMHAYLLKKMSGYIFYQHRKHLSNFGFDLFQFLLRFVNNIGQVANFLSFVKAYTTAK